MAPEIADMAEQSVLLRDMETVLSFLENISAPNAQECRRTFAGTPLDVDSMRRAIASACHNIAQSDGHVTGLSFNPYSAEELALFGLAF